MKSFYRNRKLFFFVCLPLLSLIMHWRVFHYEIGGIHAWRQSQTAINILNFNRYDANILNPRTNVLTRDLQPTIYRYEFPILQWAVGMIMHITGDNFVTTRSLMFLLGLFTVFGMYYWLKQFFDDELSAMAGAWAFSFSPVFFYYTMNPLPDNLALCSTIWSMAFFFRFLKTKSLWSAAGSAFFISLAIASKLPFIVFLAAQASWWIWSIFYKKFKNIGVEFKFAAIFLVIITPALWWYAWVIPTWDNGVLAGITDNKLPWDVTMNTIKYHLKIMFPALLLGYVSILFLLPGVFYALKRKTWKDSRFWWLAASVIGVMVYFIFEFNMIGIVHDYYMMPFLPLLYFVVAFGISQFRNSFRWSNWMVICVLCLMPIVTFRMTWNSWAPMQIPQFQDVYMNYKDLRQAAPKSAKCIILNDVSGYVFSYLIDKQGFVFDNDHLPGGWVKDMIDNYDVTYMYSISRTVENDPEVNQYFEKMVLERGNVRVFLLKRLE